MPGGVPYALGGDIDLRLPLPVPPLGDSAPLQVEALALPEGVELKWRAPLENSRFALRVDAGSGTFTITFTTPEGTQEDGATAFTTAGGTAQTTDPIPFNASAADIRAELLALSNLDEGDVFTSGGLLSDPTTLVDLIGIELSGQYQGVRIDTLTMDPTNLVDIVEALLQVPPDHLNPRREIERFHVQVWLEGFDTDIENKLRNDEWIKTESVVHPTQEQVEHFTRVRSISTDGTPGAWVETSVTPTALPTGSDGEAPDAASAPTVRGGVGFLAVEWDVVDNDSTVTYEVHVSTSTGFTPGAGTLSGEIDGTLFFIKAMPDASALAYGTTYYVKIVSKDTDGTATASGQASAQMVQVNTDDIAVNSIIASKILAGTITADKLNVSTLSAITANLGTVTAGDITGVTITGGIVRTAEPNNNRVQMVGGSPDRVEFYEGGTLRGTVSALANSGRGAGFEVYGQNGLFKIVGSQIVQLISESNNIQIVPGSNSIVYITRPVVIEATTVPGNPAGGHVLFSNNGKLWAKGTDGVSHQLTP